MQFSGCPAVCRRVRPLRSPSWERAAALPPKGVRRPRAGRQTAQSFFSRYPLQPGVIIFHALAHGRKWQRAEEHAGDIGDDFSVAPAGGSAEFDPFRMGEELL